MSKDWDKKLSRVLDKYAEYYFDKVEGFGSAHTLNKEEALASINELVLDLIGENERTDTALWGKGPNINLEAFHRNKFRQQLRDKLEGK